MAELTLTEMNKRKLVDDLKSLPRGKREKPNDFSLFIYLKDNLHATLRDSFLYVHRITNNEINVFVTKQIIAHKMKRSLKSFDWKSILQKTL